MKYKTSQKGVDGVADVLLVIRDKLGDTVAEACVGDYLLEKYEKRCVEGLEAHGKKKVMLARKNLVCFLTATRMLKEWKKGKQFN